MQRSAGPVDIFATYEADTLRLHEYDLVVIGGPTEGHTTSKPLSDYLDEVGDSFTSRSIATFDTRLRWPAWLSGSAARTMAGKLEKLGAMLVAPPASFMVSGKPPVLEPGELERAEGWGRALATTVSSATQLAALS